MELEIINKLYLELSQVATVKTRRELELEDLLRSALAIAAVKELRHELLAKEQCIRSLCMDSAEEESLLEKHGVVMHDGYSNIGIVAGIEQLIAKYEAKLATAERIKVPDKLANKIRDHMQPEEFPGPYVVKKQSLQYVLEDDAGNILARDSATDSHLQLAADCMNFVASLVKN